MNTTEIIKQLNSETKINITCWLLKNKKGLKVSDLEELINCKRSNISKQINEMRVSGMVVVKQEGRYNFYFLNNDLHEEQLNMIKAAVNSFHYIDENNKEHQFHQ